MRPIPRDPRWRLLLPPAILLTVTLVIVGVRQPTRATGPSAPAEVPAGAFAPITLPEPSTSRRAVVPGVARVRDADPRDTWRTAAPATADPSPPSGPEHIVQSGDTLWQIAAAHRANIHVIVRWNVGIDPRRLVVGQRILVPGGSPMLERPPAPPPARARTSAPAVVGHRWPLPVRGTITTWFSSAHPAIDIAAGAGTPVLAIAKGTVTWAGWMTNGGGYVVVIRHPDGMLSTYNHNRRVLVRKGQAVAGGTPIAEVGATGRATGPHLDIRIEMGGRFVDPMRLF